MRGFVACIGFSTCIPYIFWVDFCLWLVIWCGFILVFMYFLFLENLFLVSITFLAFSDLSNPSFNFKSLSKRNSFYPVFSGVFLHLKAPRSYYRFQVKIFVLFMTSTVCLHIQKIFFDRHSITVPNKKKKKGKICTLTINIVL